ncbi:hypothetical protein AYI69_g217 [Smittium culicis]|uniref:Uncharacterized protein n=1 Tax=Smittium culicis TaxID=133412 RepID=A0A1R1YTP0_9FUNG|nr:hypothetical protein AYI69_g217 [Smittium culicis]
MEEPIRVSSMESVISSSGEGQAGTSDHITNYPALEICDLIPRPSGIISLTAATTSSKSRSFRPQKRKITITREQNLEPDGLAEQRSILHAQDLSSLSIDIIVSK